MATELSKYHLVPNNNNNNNHNNNIATEFRDHFSLFKTKKTTTFVYGLVFVFIAFTLFLTLSPFSSSLTSTSSWFINIFTVNDTSPPNQSFRSPLSPDFSFNLTQIPLINSSRFQDIASVQVPTSNDLLNLTNTQLPPDKDDNFEFNTTNSIIPQKPTNQISTNLSQIPPVLSNHDENFEFNTTNSIIPKKPTNQISTNLPQISPVSSNHGENFEFNTTNSIIPQKPTSQISTNLPQISPVLLNQVGNFQPNDTVSNTIVPQISSTDDVTPEKHSDLSGVILPKNSQLPEHATVEIVKEKGGESDFTASLSKKQNNASDSGNDTVSGEVKKQGKDLVGSLVDCDLYDGGWVKDDSYPLYKPGSCKFIDEQFNCKFNGRPDDDYQKLKWKPKGCTLPRLNGRKMLKLLRGKRLVFVGDSLNRNMWESLVCILRNSVKNPENVYEAYGRRYFRNEVSYSFVFKDYNCTVEFFVAPFLVRPWEIKAKNGTTIKETLRLDLVVEESEHFKNADVLIFNTGHWWTHEKTSKGEDYYQEGSNVYKQLDVIEAFRKAMTTWGRWIDANVNPQRTHIFFRGYSNTHFSGGQWNSGGQCDNETEPIRNETYLTQYPSKMEVLEKVMRGIKAPISYLNITRMTDYRKDAHPSVYRKEHLSAQERNSPLSFQDCSHWCLPGVPDLWNELLYAEMLRKRFQERHQTHSNPGT